MQQSITIQQYSSVVRLSRWYNGQAAQCWARLQRHHLVLSEIVEDELARHPSDLPIELNIGGIIVVCSNTEDGIKLLSISPPLAGGGIQRSLFTLGHRPRQRDSAVQLTKRGRRLLQLIPGPVGPSTRRGA